MKNIISSCLVVAGLLVSCLGSAFGAIRAITPQRQDVASPKGWWNARLNEKNVCVTNGGSRLVFIGDSITHFWEGAGKVAWRKYFAGKPYQALDLGFSADRTEHVLWRITEGKELDGYEAKCIFLMIGTNNTGHFPFEKEPPVDTILGVREILRVIAEKQPKARVILSAIFPCGRTAQAANRMRNNTVNRELSKLADGKRVIWCDFSDKFLTGDGYLVPELFPDALHPSALGYEIWASSALPLIDRVMTASPDEIIPSVWPSAPTSYLKESRTACRPVAAFGEIKWWNTRCLEKRNEIADNAGREYDVVMVGDSITHRWEREGGEGRALFAELKKTYHILNLGYGGDRTEHCLWRMQNGELEGYKAKCFTVMIGTNNGGRNPADIAEGVKLIVNTITAKHPESKVILMPIFPRSAMPDDKLRVANEKVNAIIKNLADGKQVEWLDFNAQFLDAKGVLTKDVMNDLLHPNEKGYAIWRAALEPRLKALCGK